MVEDPELNAMQAAFVAVKDLDDESKLRVINWMLGKFSLIDKKINISNVNFNKEYKEGNLEGNNIHSKLSDFAHVAELFAKAEPKTDIEKALVVGTYLQEVQGVSELTGRLINDELKHLGHGASNITTTISILISKKPNLMIQTRKEGKSQQAQKKYKVTTEGVKMVNEMINNKQTE
jgi:hypothetical protein